MLLYFKRNGALFSFICPPGYHVQKRNLVHKIMIVSPYKLLSLTDVHNHTALVFINKPQGGSRRMCSFANDPNGFHGPLVQNVTEEWNRQILIYRNLIVV